MIRVMMKPQTPGTTHLQRITYAPQFGKLAETVALRKCFMKIPNPGALEDH
jgi:hypothetical protein